MYMYCEHINRHFEIYNLYQQKEWNRDWLHYIQQQTWTKIEIVRLTGFVEGVTTRDATCQWEIPKKWIYDSQQEHDFKRKKEIAPNQQITNNVRWKTIMRRYAKNR